MNPVQEQRDQKYFTAIMLILLLFRDSANYYLTYKPSIMKKLFTLIIAVLLWAGSSRAQTTLISPTGDGGFENGTTFAANGWTESNSANNPWVVGTYVSTPPFVNRSAYVSNDGGATNNYTNTLSALNYIYRDVVIPSGQTAIILTFNWECYGESSYDMIQIFVGPTSIVPIGTTTYPGSGLSNVPAGIAGATFIGAFQLQSTIQTATFFIPGSFAGTTMRLIIAWKDDTSGGTAPGGSLDNISLTSQTPVPMTGVYTIDPAGSGGSNFTTFAAAISTLNLNGVGSGGVTFSVADGATFNETGLPIFATGTSANPIIFQKSGTGTKPIVNFTGGSGTTDFGFELASSDYITFNGLDIRDAGTSSSNYIEYGFYFLGTATNGCQNNTVKNCNIDLTKANTSSRGVYTSSIATTSAGANSFNKFYNNTVQDTYNGYYFVGSSTIVDDNNEVNTQSGGTSLIDNLGNNLSTTLYGIYLSYQTNMTIANTTLSNITCATSIYGIYDGSGTTNTFNFYSNEIKNITASSTSSTVYGMYIATGVTNNIYSNLIHGMVAPYTVYAIYIGGGTTNNIYKNSIYDINYSGVSTLIAYGLAVAGGTTNNVYNNFIYDIRAAGGTTGNPSVRALNISGGTTDNVFYNTVYLNYTSTSATNQSAALYATTTPTQIDLRDNIFINKTDVTTGTYAVAFYQASAYLTNLSTNTNNNLYYAGTPGAKNLIHYDVTNSDQTLTAYKGRVSPKDASAVTENPPFVSAVSPYNLHMQTTVATQCESGGTPVNSPIVVNTDYDGDTRNATKPDIGADEFAGIPLDLTPPNISYTPLFNTSFLTARTLTTSITDATGVPTSGIGLPVLYWKINSGSYSPATATWVSGSTYTFTFGAGVVLGNVVSYYIVAQDIATTPNVGANPLGGASGFTYNPPACSTPPTSPNTYTIVQSVALNVTVGSGGTYPTLTGAGGLFADINTKVLVGNITAQIVSDLTEDGTNALNQMAEEPVGSNFTLTIKPNSATLRTVSGSYSGGLIRLNGADNVIFDGRSNGSGNYLSFLNNITSGTTSVFQLISLGSNAGATNNIIRNCIIKNGFITSGAYGIVCGGSTVASAGADNDNNTFRENLISKAYAGIWAQGLAASNPGLMDNLQVIGNSVGSATSAEYLGHDGIILAYGSGCMISQNTVYNIITTNATPVGITLSTGLVSSTINGNNMNNITYTSTVGYGGRGMYINTTNSASNLTITNNLVYVIGGDGYSSFSNSSPVGMYFDGTTGGLNIYHNSVYMSGFCTYSSTTLTTAILFYTATITNVNLRDNLFENTMDNVALTTDKNYAIYSTAPASSFTDINYNDYYVTGAQGILGYLGADQVTLAAWRTATGKDANSINTDPVFVSTTDLHPTNAAIDNLGTYIATVPTDYAGVSRTNPPDMGAYEFGTNPLVNTLAATDVDCSGGTLNGTINANGLTVNSYFDYGATTAYGSSIAAIPATVTGTTVTPISVFLSIPPSTTLHFRAKGITSAGVAAYGSDMTITTTATGAPLATTLPATAITDINAVLNGSVNALCNSTTVTFQYGLNISYGSTVTAVQSPVNGGAAVAVNGTATGLTLNTLYHFRVVATSTLGTTYGVDLTFTTGANPPVVTTNPATNIGNFTARLNGTVSANNQNSAVTFQYGLTTSYGTTVNGIPGTVSGNTPTAVYADISALNYNTTYHFRCVAQNPAGTTYGSDQAFTTLCPIPDPAGTITGPTTICQGTTGNVYTVPAINYAYNGYVWTVPPGGTITAGAGTNSITVSYSSSATSGNVTVYGTSVCGNGTPSSLAVTINPVPVPVVIGPSTACITHSYIYSTAAGMSGYIWTVSAGGQILSGAGTDSINVKWNNSGAQYVTVTYTSVFGCPAAAPTTYNVSVGNLTTPTIAGSNLLCMNEGLAVYTTETGYNSYVWTVSAGGTIVLGQGTYQIEVNWTTPGNKTVTVNYANSYGCSANSPASFAVTVMAYPGTPGGISGTDEVCAGTHGVGYSVDPIPNAVTYDWTVPFGVTIVSGATTNSIVVDFALNAITGNFLVAGENICGIGPSSPPYEVMVNPIPATPVVTVGADYLLHSSAPSGNQWYYEGAEIPGATDQDYQATDEGFYWTIVTIDGCSSNESNHEQVIFVGLTEPDAGTFTIYPIPNDGRFTITAVIAGEENFTINVYNNLGVSVFEKNDFQVSGKAQQIIDLVNPSKGIYTVVLRGDHNSVIRKVIVNK
jgi:hypothetical protein